MKVFCFYLKQNRGSELRATSYLWGVHDDSNVYVHFTCNVHVHNNRYKTHAPTRRALKTHSCVKHKIEINKNHKNNSTF